jgi:hypothetical protein
MLYRVKGLESVDEVVVVGMEISTGGAMVACLIGDGAVPYPLHRQEDGRLSNVLVFVGDQISKKLWSRSLVL